MSASSNHTFYYKILDAAPPSPLPETLPSTELDAHDGFIHLSTAPQTPVTANLFFGSLSTLWILKVRVRDLDGEVRFPADLPGCPHVHDSVRGLGGYNVETVLEIEKGEHRDWREVPALATLED